MSMLNTDPQKRTWSRCTYHFCKCQPLLNSNAYHFRQKPYIYTSARAYARAQCQSHVRVVYVRELVMASHMCTCGVNPACERASTGRGAGRHHSCSARPCTAQHSTSRQKGAPHSHSLFWPVHLSNGPSKRVPDTPNAMAIPSRKDFS